MSTHQTSAGARDRASGHSGTGQAGLNALNAVLNGRGAARAVDRPASRRLSHTKLALVHVAKRDLQLDDDSYRAILTSAAGVASAAHLSEEGFQAVMSRLKQLGFAGRPVVASPDLGQRIGMATPAQLAYIRGMFRAWSGRDDEAALIKWVSTKYHVSALRFLDSGRASKAIEGLKKMLERKAHTNVSADSTNEGD